MKRQILVIFPLVIATLPGCSLWNAPPPDPDCDSLEIDSESELLNTQLWLRDSPDAKNVNGGAFSFAGRLAALRELDSRFDPSALLGLLGVELPLEAGAEPFRLIGLVNRIDLSEQLAPESPAGEARLAYALTDGPGDDSTSSPLPLTLIFEYSLGSNRGVREWASAFHALGASAATDTSKLRDTRELVLSITQAADESGAPTLSQVRVNDARSGTPMFYELALVDGVLARRGLRNTPRTELAGTDQLQEFAAKNAGAIEAGQQRVPKPWLTDSAELRDIDWLPRQTSLEHSFSRGTCPGCHGAEGPGRRGFHLQLTSEGDVERSSFLSEQELPRRAAFLRAQLCAH